MKIYFSDFFNVDPDTIEEYGAFNISLINDLPLFIDPFLLFNNPCEDYQELHREILQYVAFLRDKSLDGGIQKGLLKSWYLFPEVKQNWLGYSKVGNNGSGLGIDFAQALHSNLHHIFSNFGDEEITKSSHIEKLCLIKGGVGRDNISDFTTNLIKGYLLRYTETFAKQYIDKKYLKNFTIRNVRFDFDNEVWISGKFLLPALNNDFVLLTPKDILTKDDNWINKGDIVCDFNEILTSIGNQQLRAEISNYFARNLPKQRKKKGGGFKAPTKKEIANAVSQVLRQYPQFIDYYIRFKEDNGDLAKSYSTEKVKSVEHLFITKLSSLINTLIEDTEFYEISDNTFDESMQRVLFLKDVIENKDGYKVFYLDGKPISRENDLHIMYRLTFFASKSDVTREANEGRGPVDFKISRGANNKTLVEFKLASNSKLKQNLEHQVEIYKKAHNAQKAIKVILYFSTFEQQKVQNVLKSLKLENDPSIVLINAIGPKPSASNAKSH